ncbi:MAG: hypothetical protein H8E13_00505 [Actinobacteria bacterium]|nr:hypothetical protein [Actinomycetota bacterium]
MKTVILISCSKRKLSYSAKARHMYQGANFKKSLLYAEMLNADKIFILSAKYGLLKLDTVIEPYDETLNKKPEEFKRIWSKKVLKGLEKEMNILNDKIIFLAGKNYIKYLKIEINNYETPLEGYNMFQLSKRLIGLIGKMENE